MMTDNPVKTHKRTGTLAIGLVLLLVALIALSQGEYPLSEAHWLALLEPGAGAASPIWEVVIELRLPRVLLAIVVGSALALSGLILQGLTRNVLADPGIIGVNQGAALAALATIVLWPTVSATLLPLAALGGAGSAVCLIYWVSRNSSNVALILIGIGLSALLSAGIGFILAFADPYQVNRALTWLIGSLAYADWPTAYVASAWVLVLLPATLFLLPTLDLKLLGNDMAGALGGGSRTAQVQGVFLAAALAGIGVAAAGTLAFVGLIAPHLARLLFGTLHRHLLLPTALLGSLLTLIADTIARRLFAPTQLPVGVVMSVVGVAVFISLLHLQKKRMTVT
jgi:iron complex transport system permease protein